MTTIDAKNKTTTELAIWLEGLSTGDTVYYTEYPNFDEAAKRLRTQEARIAELEAQTDAEPVAWTWWETSIVGMHPITFARVNLTKPEVQPNMLMLAPLYTHPPKQAKAITAEDVTDEMIAEIDAKDKAFDYSKIDMSSDTALRDAKKHAVVEIFNTVIDTFNGVKP